VRNRFNPRRAREAKEAVARVRAAFFFSDEWTDSIGQDLKKIDAAICEGTTGKVLRSSEIVGEPGRCVSVLAHEGPPLKAGSRVQIGER